MAKQQKTPSFDDVAFPASQEAAPDVKVWQSEKIKAGLKQADAGRFATPDAVKAVIQKFIPNG